MIYVSEDSLIMGMVLVAGGVAGAVVGMVFSGESYETNTLHQQQVDAELRLQTTRMQELHNELREAARDDCPFISLFRSKSEGRVCKNPEQYAEKQRQVMQEAHNLVGEWSVIDKDLPTSKHGRRCALLVDRDGERLLLKDREVSGLSCRTKIIGDTIQLRYSETWVRQRMEWWGSGVYLLTNTDPLRYLVAR